MAYTGPPRSSSYYDPNCSREERRSRDSESLHHRQHRRSDDPEYHAPRPHRNDAYYTSHDRRRTSPTHEHEQTYIYPSTSSRPNSGSYDRVGPRSSTNRRRSSATSEDTAEELANLVEVKATLEVENNQARLAKQGLGRHDSAVPVMESRFSDEKDFTEPKEQDSNARTRKYTQSGGAEQSRQSSQHPQIPTYESHQEHHHNPSTYHRRIPPPPGYYSLNGHHIPHPQTWQHCHERASSNTYPPQTPLHEPHLQHSRTYHSQPINPSHHEHNSSGAYHAYGAVPYGWSPQNSTSNHDGYGAGPPSYSHQPHGWYGAPPLGTPPPAQPQDYRHGAPHPPRMRRHRSPTSPAQLHRESDYVDEMSEQTRVENKANRVPDSEFDFVYDLSKGTMVENKR